MRTSARLHHSLAFGISLLAGAAPLRGQAPGGPPPPPPARYQYTVEKGVMIPMRDGVRLAANVYRPAGAGDRLPVVLMRTPYNKETYGGATRPAEFWAGQGYVVVSQDVRGQFASEGEYRVQALDARDGYDTIDWIVKQPWATDKVGTYGCSYLGEVQYLLATMRHPNHAAMIAQSASGATGPAGGFYTNFGTYEGGAVTLSSIFGWFGLAGHKVRHPPDYSIGSTRYEFDYGTMLRSLPLVSLARRAGYPPSDYEDFVSHPPADPYWRAVGYLSDQDRFDTPALHVNSWLDVTPEQTMYVFNLMRRRAVSARGRDHQYAIMSPTTHCASETATEHTRIGAMDVGDARLDYWNIYTAWFDHWLRGVDNGVTRRPRVTYYVMHDGWREAPSWPVPRVEPTPFYLGGSGRGRGPGAGTLSRTRPGEAGRDRFTYDPADPLPSKGGTICCTGNAADQPGIFDQTALESRPDLLIYTSPPLTAGLTIAGPVHAVVFLSSDARDTDVTAKLLDVDPEGRAWNVLNGVKRVRYRDGMDHPALMRPGQVYRVEVSLKASAYRFRPGHRVRLWLSSSDFPLYDRNLNTGGNNYDETSWVTATNTVHTGAGRASYLILPVAPR